MLAGIFERLAHDRRHTTGGVPDLVVWNTETGQFKVEIRATLNISILHQLYCGFWDDY